MACIRTRAQRKAYPKLHSVKSNRRGQRKRGNSLCNLEKCWFCFAISVLMREGKQMQGTLFAPCQQELVKRCSASSNIVDVFIELF